MKILLLKESCKNDRVLLVPNDVKELKSKGFEIYFEKNVGLNSGFTDAEYINAGAILVKNYKKDINQYHFICKTGLLKPSLLKKIKDTQIIWSYTNIVNNSKYLYKLLNNKNTFVSLKSLECKSDPSIFSISENLKGKFAIAVASFYLSKINKNGLGKLFGKVAEFNSTVFVVGGANFAGKSIIKSSLCLGSDVVVFDYNEHVVDEIKKDQNYKQLCKINNCTMSVFKYDFEKLFSMVRQADVVVCCADSPNVPSHEIFNEKMISTMKKGTVFIDLSSEFGFSSETETKPTKLNKAIFTSLDIIHFNVQDVSKYYPCTFANIISKLNTVYLLATCENTFNIKNSTLISPGVITYKGFLTNKEFAKGLNLNYTKISDIK